MSVVPSKVMQAVVPSNRMEDIMVVVCQRPCGGVGVSCKRRPPVARLFPKEASLLRLISALLVEISEAWEAGKIYLHMDATTQPSV